MTHPIIFEDCCPLVKITFLRSLQRSSSVSRICMCMLCIFQSSIISSGASRWRRSGVSQCSEFTFYFNWGKIGTLLENIRLFSFHGKMKGKQKSDFAPLEFSKTFLGTPTYFWQEIKFLYLLCCSPNYFIFSGTPILSTLQELKHFSPLHPSCACPTYIYTSEEIILFSTSASSKVPILCSTVGIEANQSFVN